jgi:pyruvate dehydrogenase (quinone)
MISDIATNNAVFTVDVGESTVWAARYIKMHGSRRMIGSFNHGSMGCALPMALGASAINPKREVWCLCGDGGFQMSMQDLVTAYRFQWPIKILIFNNSELGFVKMENEVSGYPLDPAATSLINPDFAVIAQACGITGIRLEDPAEIENVIRMAQETVGPVLIDAIVSPGELTLPPKVSLRQAFGFGVSKVKEGLLGLKGDHQQWKNWKAEFDANLKMH